MTAMQGYRILDLSEVMMGPAAAQVMADFGADVIKVERPGRGDVMRGLDVESVERGDMSCYFAAVNRGKRSIVLDLKREAGREVLFRLVASADVLIHNFRPGAMERLGLSFDELCAINPRLVYAVGLGFGESGPLARQPGQDMIGQSISGISMHRPSSDLPPYLHPVPFVDYAAGMTLAQGILMALLEREKSGLGQKITVSLFDTALAMQAMETSSRMLYQRETNWVSDHFPNGTFRTLDGWITVLGLFRENPLQLICVAFGADDLSADPRYGTKTDQSTHKQDLVAFVAPLFAKHSTEDCLDRLTSVDILCAPVLGLEAALEHPQVRHNKLLTRVELEGQDTYSMIGNPLTFSRSSAVETPRVAALGSSTTAVLDEIGFGPEDQSRLSHHLAFGITPQQKGEEE